MKTKLLSEKIFSKNIEEKFSSTYENYSSPIVRILILGKHNISTDSLTTGITLRGCIVEINNLFNEYLNRNKKDEINYQFNELHTSIYNYIKYINLNVNKLDFVKLTNVDNFEITKSFFKSIFCTLIMLKMDDIKNENSKIYNEIIIKLIKNILLNIKKSRADDSKKLLNLLNSLFESFSHNINSFNILFNENENKKNFIKYILIISKEIFDDIFKIGNNNKFNRKIIRNSIFENMIKNDENIKTEFFKDKYLNNKNIFNLTLFNYFKNKF